MCTDYANGKGRKPTQKRFKVSDNRSDQFDLFDQVFPRMNAPVVRRTDDGERELRMLSWGFVRHFDGKAPTRVSNTRDDSLGSRFWSASLRERRCLVPVTSFAEPKGKKPAIWHWFALNDERDQFAFAGIWRSYKGPVKKDGETVEIDTFSFLTTTPNDLVAPVHDRMPVMLVGEEAHDQWLEGTEAEAKTLITTFPADQMKIVQASEEKRDLAA